MIHGAGALHLITGLAMVAILIGDMALVAGGVIPPLLGDLVLVGLVVAGALPLLSHWTGKRSHGVVLALAAGLAFTGLRIGVPQIKFMPYLLIVLPNIFMAYLFGRGLMPGREPALLVVIRQIGKGPVTDPRFRGFIARQCALWCGFTFTTALLAGIACLPGAHRDLVTLWLTYLIVIQIAWFLGSHYYANLVHDRTETCWNTFQVMTGRAFWDEMSA